MDERADDAGAPNSRRSFLRSWAIVPLGMAIASAALFLVTTRPSIDTAAERARALDSSVAMLGWQAAAPGDEPSALAASRQAVERDLRALRSALADAGFSPSELASVERRWKEVAAAATAPDGAAAAGDLRALHDDAVALGSAIRGELEARLQARELWLQGLTLLLLATLIVPVHGLWRQRQRLRHSLKEFSSQLGDGAWKDAVRTLRDDRLGPPSAFDAMASGIEGVMADTERRWQALADLSADWYWETDQRHRLSRLSGQAPPSTRLGWNQSDVMGRRHDQVDCYEAPAMGWTAFHERLDRREAFRDVEFRVVGRRGDAGMWISISGRPRHDLRGEFVGYEGVGRDITERKVAHERLVASEQRWSLMAGLASDWYWQTDADHRLLPLAPELLRRFGRLADQIEGRTRWEAHPEALNAEQWAEHRADLDARRPFRSLQMEIEIEPGRFVWVSLSGIPRFDGQGRFLGYHGVGRDITVRKQAERLLLRHNEELQRAVGERTRELEQLNRDLDAFSRQLAHELRTPIGHVQGLAHLIEARAGARLTPEERQLLDLQVGAARSMRDTVDALLQLARSTVQPMPMDDIDLSALAQSVIGELPLIERAAPVHWQIEHGLRAHACAGALRIVLTNLLGNAAKFTRKVSDPVVRLSGRVDEGGRLRVTIEDNGAGFDATRASQLFTPFSRLHTGEEFHGTGIGLTIVQRIVERHGGTVLANGEPGGGARFDFTLAAAREA